MNLNGKQIFLIIGAIVSVLMIAGPQLTDLFGSTIAKNVASGAGLVNLMINSIMVALTGTMPQSQQIQQVLDMKGVQHLEINKEASLEVARMAVDPNVNKIAPSAESVRQVEAIAEGRG